MKKAVMILATISLLSIQLVYCQTSEAATSLFKYHMHQIFDSYNHARISMTLKKFDVTELYLRHLKEAIDSAQENMPAENKDGTKLDKELFMERIGKLKKSVSSLNEIVEARYLDPVLTNTLSMDIFNMCVACHKGVKKDSLFTLKRQNTLFGEYMHKVSDHVDLARIESEEGGRPEMLKEHIQLVNYYIDLLIPSFPDAGPSGVIMDRDRFNRRVAEIKATLEKGKKPITPEELEKTRVALNGLCVSCHEPERIK